MRYRRTIYIAALAVLTVALCLYALLPAQGLLSVTVMDVGEGLCIVARTPSGKTLIMDCGSCSHRDNQGVGETVAVPYLTKAGVRGIDVVIASHPHEDHISGFPRLFDKLPPKLVLDSGSLEKSATYRRFLAAVRRSGARYRIAERGQVLDLEDGVSVQILSPPPADCDMDPNTRCVVARMIYGRTAFLLAADGDDETELEILASGHPLRAQVLQVGHHGSANASSLQWLAAVHPQIAVISCGRNNLYGHPAPQTLARLDSLGTRIYRTDQDGAVTFLSDGATITACSMTRR